jgi:hypothetical protein
VTGWLEPVLAAVPVSVAIISPIKKTLAALITGVFGAAIGLAINFI